jgi:hypothetical protein
MMPAWAPKATNAERARSDFKAFRMFMGMFRNEEIFAG